MNRDYISNSIANMLLTEDTSPFTSAIDFYNFWIQKEKIRITDIVLAIWTLNLIKSLLATDKTLLINFLSN